MVLDETGWGLASGPENRRRRESLAGWNPAQSAMASASRNDSPVRSSASAVKMKTHRRGYVLGLLASLLGLATILGLGQFGGRSSSSPQANFSPYEPAHPSPATLPGPQQLQMRLDLGPPSNVLELPRASLDFVGYWGGFIRDAESPTGAGHVGVVFGQRGDRVFFASELYSPAGQHSLSKPRVRIIGPWEVVIEYESRDDKVDYKYSHRFKLLNPAKMAYDETVRLYGRRGHQLLTVAEQRALLKPLTTVAEWRFFSRPGADDVREGRISASRQFGSSSD